jgi:tRNA U34 5-methylaminomethyl-2-thiouridine-forming methyltransferase MnmC
MVARQVDGGSDLAGACYQAKDSILTVWFSSPTLTGNMGKDRSIAEMTQSAQSMVQGSLSEVTRQCGDPSCACAWDPTRRHGPHLYLKFSAQGKAYSIYIPPEDSETLRHAHQAWLRFQELAGQVAAANRQRFLKTLDRHKQFAKAQRAKARRKA